MALRDIKILLPLKYVKYILMRFLVSVKRLKIKNIKIENDFDAIVDDIIENKKSLARFGDGELRIAIGVDPDGPQSANEEISKRLKEILMANQENLLVGINLALKKFDNMTFTGKYFFAWFICKYLDDIVPLLNSKVKYINSSFSRIYIGARDKSDCERRFKKMKTIWNDRDILIVEGEFSRLGVGNDLFSNTSSIKRITAPAKEAFDFCEEILEAASAADKGTLIIIALGTTATILASELSKLGYQALDLGHIDLEYEWYLTKANKAEVVPGKYVNEIDGQQKINGELSELLLGEYEKTIIKRVGG